MSKRLKQFLAAIGGMSVLAIVSDTFPMFLRSIDYFLHSKQLTVGAILTMMVPFVLILIKLSKEKEKKARSLLIERRQMQIAFNINEIMEALKVESKWSIQEIGSNHTVQTNLKSWFSYLPKLSILRRKKTMDRLKSRKLWLAIFGALFPVLNVELGINLDPNIVFAVLGVVVSGIAGLAHVDGKKAQAVVNALKGSVPVDPNATYKDMFPTIKEVHEKINKFLELAKTNDVNVLTIYPQLLELLSSYEHPDPVATIPEEQVSA